MEYGRILRRSWEITKTSKVLWVFGMVIAAVSGGSANFGGGGGGGGGGEEFKLPETVPAEKLPQETSQVLGEATNNLAQIFTNTPIWVWIILAATILIAIGSAVAIIFFIRNWGKGALIASIHDVEDKKTSTLRSGSKSGLLVVKRFIVLRIIPWLLWIIFASVLSALAVGSIIAAANVGSEGAKTVIVLITVPIWALGLLVTGLFLNLSIILGEQLVVRKNRSAKEALKEGYSLTRKYFAQVFGMGAINLSLGCAFGCLTILLFALLAVMVVVAFAISKTAGIIVGAVVAIPILAFILFSLLIRGIYMVFNTATWTLLVREIEQKERNKVTDGK